MFNSTSFNLKSGDNIANVSLNAPSTGMIQKSNPRSRFINVAKGSREFECLFPKSFEESPRIEVRRTVWSDDLRYGGRSSHMEVTKKEVTVLQCMVYGQDEFLVEYLINEDIQ